MTTDIIILAAGQGSRMRSTMPKVLHRIGGKTMLQHVIDQSNKLTLPAVKTHVVVGHEAAQIEAAIAGQPIKIAEQREQLGTGHAVAQALPSIAKEGVSLILYGDVPLIQPGTMQALIADAEQSNLALLTVNVDNPRGYGRIVRDENNQVTAIVEHKDATLEQQKIAEINSGILALPNELLVKWLAQLNNNNAQGEYYLTDIIAIAAEEGVTINGHQPATQQEVQGVNDKAQLAYVERWYQRQEANRLMLAGATLADPNRVDIRGTVEIKGEVSIDCNVIFEGDVILEQGVSIGANCIIKDSVIGAHSIIKANSMIEESEIAAQCEIGPFARLRPGTKMANKAKIGNFVETKKAIIGEGSKVNHLSYIGDSLIGAKVNIGAGTITCNYDGVNKFTTEIGDAAFIGSNSALVAPVKVGSGATVGAGSTVTKDIAADQLAVARGKQININNWQRPVKEVKE